MCGGCHRWYLAVPVRRRTPAVLTPVAAPSLSLALEVGATKPASSVRPAVTDDATLSDFLEAETETDDTDADADADADAGAGSDEDPDSIDGDGNAEGEPIDDTESTDAGLSTYAWGEYACDRCGADTERVWREDGTLVCPDCKSW